METTTAERFAYMRKEVIGQSQTQLAESLKIQQQVVAHIESGRTQRISPEILKILVDEYLINVEWLLWGYGRPTKIDDQEALEYKQESSCGCYDVPYWEKLPEELKRPQITSVHCDLELVESDWMRKTMNLRTIPMLGSSMNTYIIPLKDRNMLIMDLSSTDINKNGVYLFTTNGGNNLYIRFLSLLMDGSVKITAYENNEEKTKVLTPEQQKEFDFNVVGRILINASLTI